MRAIFLSEFLLLMKQKNKKTKFLINTSATNFLHKRYCLLKSWPSELFIFSNIIFLIERHKDIIYIYIYIFILYIYTFYLRIYICSEKDRQSAFPPVITNLRLSYGNSCTWAHAYGYAQVHELPWGHWQIGNKRRKGTLSVFFARYIWSWSYFCRIWALRVSWDTSNQFYIHTYIIYI